MCVVSDLLKDDREFVNELTSEQFLDALVEVFFKKEYPNNDEVKNNLDKCLLVWNDDRLVEYLAFVCHRHAKHLDVILYPFCIKQWFGTLERVSDKYLDMGIEEFNRLRKIIDESVTRRKVEHEH